LTAATKTNYRDVLRLHVIPVLGGKRLKDIGADEVEAVFAGMTNRKKPRSGSYQRQAAKAMTRVFNYAIARNLIAESPLGKVVLPSGAPTREIVVPERDTAKLLISEAPTHRLTAFTTIILYTGLRISEVLALRWRRDIDLTRGVLKVHSGKGGKPRNGLIMPPLDQALRTWSTRLNGERLASVWWAGDQPDWVLPSEVGTQWETHNARKQFKKYADLIAPGVTPHSLRHTATTLMFEEGATSAEVSHILGHADVKLALQTYAKVTDRLQDQAMSGLVAALA
jgi:integrase